VVQGRDGDMADGKSRKRVYGALYVLYRKHFYDYIVRIMTNFESRYMKKFDLILPVILICSVAATCATDYIGGYIARPLDILLFPAVLFPAFIALLAFLILSIKSVIGLIRRTRRYMSLLNIGIMGLMIVIIAWVPIPGYLHGLRDRFKNEIGYDGLREFAYEFEGLEELVKHFPEVAELSYEVLKTPNRYGPLSNEEQKIWDDFADKFEFLRWNRGTAHVFIYDNIVEVSWGSGLIGHFGFQVALHGAELKNQRRGRYLKVEDDIQFLYVD